MTCWSGHVPHMNEEQLSQATRAYYRAAMNRAWTHAWQSPVNPFTTSQTINLDWATAHNEPPVSAEPSARARQTSLEEARQSDKVDAIDVAFVRVR